MVGKKRYKNNINSNIDDKDTRIFQGPFLRMGNGYKYRKEMIHGGEEMTTGSIVVQTGVTGAAITFFSDTILDMVPYLFAALVLIAVDLYFGIKAAARRKERIRPSRAIRRTVGKCFEYLCWVSLSATLSVAFDIEAIEWVILGVVMGNEVISITSNWFEVHGKAIKGLNIWKIVGDKANIDLSDVKVEDIDNGNDK